MTVAMAGEHEGTLRDVIREANLETDQPIIETKERIGRINADLSVGVDVTNAEPLLANEGLCSNGMKPLGSGFLVTAEEAKLLGLGVHPGLDQHVRQYRNGRDLIRSSPTTNHVFPAASIG